ncbi:hypothetical protein B0H63DRAFT_501335 [Podospora didyma]|uniref:Uncharacterized protein n=1 Tax=Podospora didyma TaxID=330526 RepID=A0AAE0NPX2_9PEZI|nr:hypothetical protein B0H63DRAFT_501335 [Podospora didyma]
MGKQKGKAPIRPFIPGFMRLGPSVYVRDSKQLTLGYPHEESSFASSSSTPPPPPSGSSRPPELIIITSWTGAIPKHITKYTEAYASLYPGVPILVVTTAIADLALRSMKTKMKALEPAIEYLCAAITTFTASRDPEKHTTSTNNILLHAFSEGGAHKSVCLAQAYQQRTGLRLPIGAFVFDSTPGTPRYKSNVAAFQRALPQNPVAQAVGLPVSASVLGVTWVLFSVFVGYDNNLISKTRRALNDEKLWNVVGVPRTYLFSEADDLICWKDVEAHGVMSARPEVGVKSLLVRFKDTGHCGHARGGNEKLYWEAVKRTWEAKIGSDCTCSS